jgi:hypothetical protein
MRDIGEARLLIDELVSGAPEEMAAAATAATEASSVSRGARLSWFIAAAAVLVAAVLTIPALRHLRETAPPAPWETRVDIVTPATDSPSSFALSPDGRQIVFVASGDGVSRLWLRSLATTTTQPPTDKL